MKKNKILYTTVIGPISVFLISFLLLNFQAFAFQNSLKKTDNYNYLGNIADSTNEKLKLWRKDSLACLKIRNAELAFDLSNELNLKKSNKEKVIILLGQPFSQSFTNRLKMQENENDSIKFISGEILEYLIDCSCHEGKFPDMKSSYIFFEIFIRIDTGEVVDIGFFNSL